MINLFKYICKYTTTIILFFIIYSGNSFAEDLENVLQSLERIENDVKDLQKEVYRDKKIEVNNDNNSPGNNFSVLDIRIRDIENQISELINYIEEYVFKIDELNDRLDDYLLQESAIIKNNNEIDDAKLNETNSTSSENGSYVDDKDQTLGSISISNDNLNDNEEVGFGTNILPDSRPEDQYQFAFSLLREQKLEEAKRAFEEFIDLNNNHILAGSANYWIGQIIFLQGNYKEAALVFAEGYQNYPESKKVPDMLLRLSISLAKIDKAEQACSTLKELINTFPESKLIKQAQFEFDTLNCQ